MVEINSNSSFQDKPALKLLYRENCESNSIFTKTCDNVYYNAHIDQTVVIEGQVMSTIWFEVLIMTPIFFVLILLFGR